MEKDIKRKMDILILEDNVDECKDFITSLQNHNDFNLLTITDSDIEALECVKLHKPEGIVLDIELNNSTSGNLNSLDFLTNIKNLNLDYNPIIVVTTHVLSNRVYEIFRRNGIDTILYKNHPSYSVSQVLNTLLSLRIDIPKSNLVTLKDVLQDERNRISEYIDYELSMIGISPKLKGREYLYSAIFHLVENRDNINIVKLNEFLVNKYHKSDKTINNGMRTAILSAWRNSPIEDLTKYYTDKINPETGYPSVTQFIYHYYNKIKKKL